MLEVSDSSRINQFSHFPEAIMTKIEGKEHDYGNDDTKSSGYLPEVIASGQNSATTTSTVSRRCFNAPDHV